MAAALQSQLAGDPQLLAARQGDSLPIAGVGGGTLITTDDGPIPVDWLRPGDKILTLDNGYQPIRWIGRDCLIRDPEDIPAVQLPIRRILANETLKNPILAARHRVVLSGWQVELYFGVDTLLAEASLLADDQIFFPNQKAGTTACSHILMDVPQIIQANGAWVESTQLSPDALACFAPRATDKIAKLRLDMTAHLHPACGIIYAWEAKKLGLDLVAMLSCDHGTMAKT